MDKGIVFMCVALSAPTATATLLALASDVSHLQAALPGLLHHNLDIITFDFLYHLMFIFFTFLFLPLLERLYIRLCIGGLLDLLYFWLF